MKKTLSLMVATGMLLGLVACGSSGADAPSENPAEQLGCADLYRYLGTCSGFLL